MKADTGGPGRAPRAAAAPPRGAATRTGRLRLSVTSGALPQRPGCPAGTAPCPRRSSVPVSPVKLSQPSAAPARISRARGSTASARRNKVAAPRRGRIPSRRARAAAGSPVGGCQRLIPPPLPVNARSLPGHRRCPPKEAPGAAAPLPPLRAHTDTQIRCVRLRESAPPPSGCSDLKPTGNLSVLVAAPAGGSGEEERFLLLLFLLFFSPLLLIFNGSELGVFAPRRFRNIYMLSLFVVAHRLVRWNHPETARCSSRCSTWLCP